MFSWFLKLLGINEDKPVPSGSSLLDANKKNEPEQSIKEVTIETQLIAKPETAIKTEVKPEVEPIVESEKEAEPELEKEPEPEPEEEESKPEQVKSLIDEFPSLKANVIKALSDAGFSSKELIDKAGDKDLLALKGIGPASIKVLRS